MNSPNVDVASGNRGLLWQEVEKLDEHRRYPRVPLNIKAPFVTDTGRTFSVEVINISPDGLQVACSAESVRLICPQIRKINTPCVNAAISLPVGHDSRTLAVRCQMLYVKMVDTELGFVAGMRFVQLDLQAKCILIAFFADQLMHERTAAEVA